MNTKLSTCCERCVRNWDTGEISCRLLNSCPCHTEESTEKCKSHPQCSHNTGDRSMDKPCSIEFPNQAKEEDWKTDFSKKYDEWYCEFDKNSKGKKPMPFDLIPFIQKILDKEYIQQDNFYRAKVSQAVKKEREKLATQIFGLDDIFYDEEPGAMIKKDDVIGIINKE